MTVRSPGLGKISFDITFMVLREHARGTSDYSFLFFSVFFFGDIPIKKRNVVNSVEYSCVTGLRSKNSVPRVLCLLVCSISPDKIAEGRSSILILMQEEVS